MRSHRHSHLTRTSARGNTSHHGRRTRLTLGDLISAAYDVGGSTDGATRLLSPASPLSHLINRRIVIDT